MKTDSRLGDPAGEIVDYASKNGVDLIVMASHGRTGVARWALGSVAERVFRATCVPVLMVRAPGLCRRALCGRAPVRMPRRDNRLVVAARPRLEPPAGRQSEYQPSQMGLPGHAGQE